MKIKHFVKYPKDVDREMVRLLNVLNSIPGCRTQYSCCGHGESEFYLILLFSGVRVESRVMKWFRDKMPELTGFTPTVENFGPYEWDGYDEVKYGIYSNELGNCPDRKRKSTLNRMAKALETDFIPVNHW